MRTPLCIRYLGAALLLGMGAASCVEAKNNRLPLPRTAAPGVEQIGSITHPSLKEDSGIAASHTFTNVIWTHTDGGKKPVLYAIDYKGETIAEYDIRGLSLEDWEDIAIDEERHLYIGDLGNNDENRTELRVHRLNEPDPTLPATRLKVDRTWHLRFPGNSFNCESLFIFEHHGYVVSKVYNDKEAALYRFDLKGKKSIQTLELVTRLPVKSPVTSAALSPGGKTLAVLTKNGPYLFAINGDPARAGQVPPQQLRFRHDHMEGICFVREGLLVTAESREIFLFQVPGKP